MERADLMDEVYMCYQRLRAGLSVKSEKKVLAKLSKTETQEDLEPVAEKD